MVLFPNCKVNIGLHVKDKRLDGYHDLETIFFPIPLRDAAEITACTSRKENTPFELIVTGDPVPGDVSQNLCTKAWQLIKSDYPSIQAVRMYLHKRIPTGAGLGGGSSDGAFTLMLLNEEFGLNLTDDKLRHYALRLGSDCPFFIINKPCYATGRGEMLEPLAMNLSDYYFVVVYPGIHIRTGEVFEKLGEMRAMSTNKGQSISLKEAVSKPVSSWKTSVFNDFEAPVFSQYPEIAKIKEALYNAGAQYASMTGTGSSVFGIFNNNQKKGNLEFPKHYTVFNLKQSN